MKISLKPNAASNDPFSSDNNVEHETSFLKRQGLNFHGVHMIPCPFFILFFLNVGLHFESIN